MNKFNNEQEQFWAKQYAAEYIKKNSDFDHRLGAKAWREILRKVNDQEILNYLECGCSIGRNLIQVQQVLPQAKASIIEISKPAFDLVIENQNITQAYHGAILDSDFKHNSFDLVFTMGVLIHVSPDHLIETMKKMYDYSSKYILMGEYFNRTPVSIDYQGQKNKLFKCDFGRIFIQNFDVNLVDYGFLWSYIYQNAGFDDITWFLFEKSET